MEPRPDDAALPILELHLLPGHFSEGGQRAIDTLTGEGAILRAVNLAREDDEAEGDVAQWLKEVPTGERRRARGRFRIPGGRAHPLQIEVLGGQPEGRLHVAVRMAWDRASGSTHKDLELAILGLACQILVREDHMAALVGGELGPVAAGLPRGSFGEQIAALLEFHDSNIEVLIMPTEVAQGVLATHLPHRETIGNLVVMRA
jgi:hypothetical protein